MFKTNNINSLLFPESKNSKNLKVKKSKEKLLKSKEKNYPNFRNKINLRINTITQSSQNKKPLLQKYYKSKNKKYSDSKKKNNIQKTHHSKCLTASNSILCNEIHNNHNNNNSLKKINSTKKIKDNKDEIINSYEKGVLLIFDDLKNILDQNIYNEIKNKFINEFN